MIAACLGMSSVSPIPSSRALLDFKPVFRNRAALGYIFGYGAHCFELYALRTWMVAFWTYVAATNSGSSLLQPITVSVLATVLAMPSSILGNEVAIRFGRHRAIICVMCVAGIIGSLIGIGATASPAILLVLILAYAIAIPADSGRIASDGRSSAPISRLLAYLPPPSRSHGVEASSYRPSPTTKARGGPACHRRPSPRTPAANQPVRPCHHPRHCLRLLPNHRADSPKPSVECIAIVAPRYSVRGLVWFYGSRQILCALSGMTLSAQPVADVGLRPRTTAADLPKCLGARASEQPA